jgi:hypothetical protein
MDEWKRQFSSSLSIYVLYVENMSNDKLLFRAFSSLELRLTVVSKQGQNSFSRF